MTVSSRLDELADALHREVRHAAGARADAEVAAAFDGMTKELNTVASQLESYGAVVSGPSPLKFLPTFAQSLGERKTWVDAQVKKVRDVIAEDPMKVRQGKLWSETQRSARTMRNDLAEAIDEAYHQLLEPFRGDDRDILETLPPRTPGVAEYRDAIDEFDRLAEVGRQAPRRSRRRPPPGDECSATARKSKRRPCRLSSRTSGGCCEPADCRSQG